MHRLGSSSGTVMTQIPSIPKDLVDYLDAMYAARTLIPGAGETDREVWMKLGKRELVEWLIQTRKDQETGADKGLPHVFVPTSPGVGSDDHASAGTAASSGSPAGSSFASPQDRLGSLTE